MDADALVDAKNASTSGLEISHRTRDSHSAHTPYRYSERRRNKGPKDRNETVHQIDHEVADRVQREAAVTIRQL